MQLLSGQIGAVTLCLCMTFVASVITVVVSCTCGSALGYCLRRSPLYALVLIVLFLPFALGTGIWAYSTANLALVSGIQRRLLLSSDNVRVAALLITSLARLLPLGTFFCAIALHRYFLTVRPYCNVYQVRLRLPVVCGIGRLSKPFLTLLGLFGGALFASEASIPLFLYRANPGTGPETLNTILPRLFREHYAALGPECLPSLALIGLILSLGALLAALLGSQLGILLTSLYVRALRPNCASRLLRYLAVCSDVGLPVLTGLLLVPGLLAIMGIACIQLRASLSIAAVSAALVSYRGIVCVSSIVAAIIAAFGTTVAMALRYRTADMFASLHATPAVACLFLLPAYLPVLTIVALLGQVHGGYTGDFAGYGALFLCQLAIHYPVFQVILIAIVATVPPRRIAWEKAMGFSFVFSLFTDGFKRHAGMLLSIFGLCLIQVVTDGTVSRWFSHLIVAPEESLQAAVFGRLASAREATAITLSVAIVAMSTAIVLTVAYLRHVSVGLRDV